MVAVPASVYFVTASGSLLCSAASASFSVEELDTVYGTVHLCPTPTATVPTLPFTAPLKRISEMRPSVMLILSFFVVIDE
jgi:hypothetical protein